MERHTRRAGEHPVFKMGSRYPAYYANALYQGFGVFCTAPSDSYA